MLKLTSSSVEKNNMDCMAERIERVDEGLVTGIVESGDSVDTVGTSLQGHIKASYDELTAIFGESIFGDDDKVNAEWRVVLSVYNWFTQGEDCMTVTIYDWKRNKIDYSLSTWHVGGLNHGATMHVAELLDKYRQENGLEIREMLVKV